MRQRSRTNSRNWENLGLRAAYVHFYPVCEFSQHKVAGFGGPIQADHLHHIGHQGHRWDLWSNVISLCHPAHAWCHQYPIDGVLVCTAVKMDKGEFREDEFQKCVGRRIAGFLDKVPRTPHGVAAAEYIRGQLEL